MREIRKALGMTQRDFSYYLRVSINTISGWENGHTTPSPLAEQAIRSVCVEHGLDLHRMGRFLG
jgi:DNA-binding transcriptional regulator YiaG